MTNNGQIFIKKKKAEVFMKYQMYRKKIILWEGN